MIPKVDSYFYETLRKYVDIVVNSTGTENERYIINEALGNMEQGTLDKFKKTFGSASDSKKAIDISYAFPKQKEQVDARYVIFRGKLEEDTGSIGLIQGVGEEARPANGENLKTEFLPVQRDELGPYIELGNPIYNLIGINELSSLDNFVDYEMDDGDPKRLNFLETATPFIGHNLTVTYMMADDGPRKDNGGVDYGFDAIDTIVIQAVSNNIDTVRCLDSILKYVLIIMRSTERENDYYKLAHVSSEGLQIADNDLDNPLYVIPNQVSYKTSYMVRNDTSKRFKQLLINGVGGKEYNG